MTITVAVLSDSTGRAGVGLHVVHNAKNFRGAVSSLFGGLAGSVDFLTHTRAQVIDAGGREIARVAKVAL